MFRCLLEVPGFCHHKYQKKTRTSCTSTFVPESLSSASLFYSYVTLLFKQGSFRKAFLWALYKKALDHGYSVTLLSTTQCWGLFECAVLYYLLNIWKGAGFDTQSSGGCQAMSPHLWGELFCRQGMGSRRPPLRSCWLCWTNTREKY